VASLIEAASAAARSKGTYFSAQYGGLKSRRGAKKATVAVGHSILVVAYHVLQRDTPYEELGPDYLLLRHSTEGYKRRLVRQLERLGHKVTLEPGAQSA